MAAPLTDEELERIQSINTLYIDCHGHTTIEDDLLRDVLRAFDPLIARVRADAAKIAAAERLIKNPCTYDWHRLVVALGGESTWHERCEHGDVKTGCEICSPETPIELTLRMQRNRYRVEVDKLAAKLAERDAEIAKLRAEAADHQAWANSPLGALHEEEAFAELLAVVEAARVLNATLHVTEGGLYKMVDVADDVGCSNLGGTSYEEHPDVEGAMERMTAALAALDDKGAP